MVGERPEAEAVVEGLRPFVDSLHDDGAGADDASSGQGAPGRIDQQVGAEAPALIVRVYRELSQ